MSTEESKKDKDMRMPLSEWIRPSAFQTFGNSLKQPSDGSAATALPDNDYLIPALQIASSIADQICQAEEESGQSAAPGSDWIDSIEVITDGARPQSSDADGDGCNNIRVEIMPSLLSNITTDDNNSGRAKNCRIYSLGLVFYEIFSRGERPAGVERKETEVDESKPDGLQNQDGTVELLESLGPLPLDQGGGTIDLEGVDIDDFELFKFDDLQDEHNDICGLNNDSDDSLQLQDQNSRKKTNFVKQLRRIMISLLPLPKITR